MSHIKDRLNQYKDKYSDCYKYAGVYVKVIQDIISTAVMIGLILWPGCHFQSRIRRDEECG
jgi:hypothetical protein